MLCSIPPIPLARGTKKDFSMRHIAHDLSRYNPVDTLVSLESAAEQLGIAPYWLRQHMRAHGFKELANGSTYIRLVDLRTLKQHQADISDTARRLRHEQIAEQRAAGRYSARLSWRRQLGVMRRADPGLRALNGGAR